MYRLCGIIHVLYETLKLFIDGTVPDDPTLVVLSTEISQEVVQMAIALTEYFQAQRQAYDKVHALLCFTTLTLSPLWCYSNNVCIIQTLYNLWLITHTHLT